MSKINLIATSAFGLEAIVAKELKDLGYYDQYVENGKVTFSGDLKAICETNIWLRTSDRIRLKMGEFKALTFEELFEATKALPWEDWIPEDAVFPVEGKSINSKLSSVPSCQAIVKKAVVERLKQKYKTTWFKETGATYKIEVAFLKDMATLTIDTSGAGLHKRGYRKLTGQAPLKETLASAMILLSKWAPGRVMFDPFCGSGTIPIEAAMIGMNMAPGVKREFVSEGWGIIPGKLWEEARESARSKEFSDVEMDIQGTDIDEEAISFSRHHAKMAGVEKLIHFQRRPLSEISSKYRNGIIITNPPYGERLEEKKDAERLYREMGKIFRELNAWSYFILASNPDFEKHFGLKADKKRKLYNGRIQCNLYQYINTAF